MYSLDIMIDYWCGMSLSAASLGLVSELQITNYTVLYNAIDLCLRTQSNACEPLQLAPAERRAPDTVIDRCASALCGLLRKAVSKTLMVVTTRTCSSSMYPDNSIDAVNRNGSSASSRLKALNEIPEEYPICLPAYYVLVGYRKSSSTQAVGASSN